MGSRFSKATSCRLSRASRGNSSRGSGLVWRPLARALGVTRKGTGLPSRVASTAPTSGSSTTRR